jgi:hypothetical protein
MAAVLISCPRTDGLVVTGADVTALEDLEYENVLGSCPECLSDHVWTPADAVLSAFATERATAAPPSG